MQRPPLPQLDQIESITLQVGDKKVHPLYYYGFCDVLDAKTSSFVFNPKTLQFKMIGDNNFTQIVAKNWSKDIIHDNDEFESKAEPIGKLVSQFNVNGKLFSCYEANFKTKHFDDLFHRIELFLLWFIDGASLLDRSDDRWGFWVTLDEENNIVGVISFYKFYCYPDMIRVRISQWMVLPWYQRSGIGSGLYQSFMKFMINDPLVHSVTVEDPNEFFQLLRFKNDHSLVQMFNATIDDLKNPSRLTPLVKIPLIPLLKGIEHVIYNELCSNYVSELYKKFRLGVKKRLFIEFAEELEEIEEIEERYELLDKKFHQLYR